jgi:hypothetical protein
MILGCVIFPAPSAAKGVAVNIKTAAAKNEPVREMFMAKSISG